MSCRISKVNRIIKMNFFNICLYLTLGFLGFVFLVFFLLLTSEVEQSRNDPCNGFALGSDEIHNFQEKIAFHLFNRITKHREALMLPY